MLQYHLRPPKHALELRKLKICKAVFEFLKPSWSCFSTVVAWLWHRSDRAREDRSHGPPPPPSNIVRALTTPTWPEGKGQRNYLKCNWDQGGMILPKCELLSIKNCLDQSISLYHPSFIKRQASDLYVPAVLSHWVFEYWQKYGILMRPPQSNSVKL